MVVAAADRADGREDALVDSATGGAAALPAEAVFVESDSRRDGNLGIRLPSRMASVFALSA
jgi:hypothetical protein